MNIDVDDGHPSDAMDCPRMLDRNRDIVVYAESHCAARGSVVTRRSDHSERGVEVAAHNCLDGADRTTGRHTRGGIGRRRRVCVDVELTATARAKDGDPCQVIAIVHPEEGVIVHGPRSDARDVAEVCHRGQTRTNRLDPIGTLRMPGRRVALVGIVLDDDNATHTQ